MYIRTGRYGLVLNAKTGLPLRAGALPETGEQQALREGNQPLDALPPFGITLAVWQGGARHPFSHLEAAEKNANPDGEPFPNEGNNPSRILASGRYWQRCDMMYLRFSGLPALTGRLEASCHPRQFALLFDCYHAEPFPGLRLEMGWNFPSGTKISWQKGDEGEIRLADGRAFVFLPPPGLEVSLKGASVVFLGPEVDLPGRRGAVPLPSTLEHIYTQSNTHQTIRTEDRFRGFGVPLIPLLAGESAAGELLALGRATVSARQVSPHQEERPVTYSPDTGRYTVDMRHMFTVSGADFEKGSNLTVYDELELSLHNPSGIPLHIPVEFYKPAPLSITGFCPTLRDAKTLEPIGLQVQLTKNWHGYSEEPNGVFGNAAAESPRRHSEGVWFKGLAVIPVPAQTTVTLRYTCPFATWGGVYTASHSQLCLAGWGGGQQWETAAIGSFGESFCYDIARSWTWCCMGDICPLAVYSRLNGVKYDWTGNIGGGDFLVLYNKQGKKVQHSRVRTLFRTQGPNLAEVVYTGESADSVLAFEITAFLPRINDVSHAIHRVSLRFLKNADYSHFGLYQFGADSYNYDFWQKMAVGNSEGAVSVPLNNVHQDREFSVPLSEENKTVGKPFAVPGLGLWAGFLQAKRGLSLGNKVLAVHEFFARIGGREYHKPRLSVRTTNVLQWKSALFELNPPVEGPIPAGSEISFCVDYINLPIVKSDYYGESPSLLDIPDNEFDTWRILWRYAAGEKYACIPEQGKLLRTLPASILCEPQGGVYCLFTLSGGMGYVPVTLAGLPGYMGWRLEKETPAGWEPVSQAVHGNDWWQTFYNAEKGYYELTFNLPAGKARYRLLQTEK